jgi:hypothetical protein
MSSDKILIEARNDSIQVEQIAAEDLRQNIGDYLEPNWRARRAAEAYRKYTLTSVNDQDEYMNMRAAFSETKGKSNKVFSDVIASHVRKTRYDMSQTLFGEYVPQQNGDKPAAAAKPAAPEGDMMDDTTVSLVNGEDGEDETADAWAKVIQGAARHLELHGYWKAKFTIPETIVESLKQKILGKLVENHGDKVQAALDGKPGAPMQIKGDARWLAAFEEMYQLSSDPLLLSIVQAYMGVPPIFNTPVSFLNSFVKAKNDKQLSDTAQLYHHDMHRLGFVKMFVYLSDVNLTSGPHVLLRGTHRNRPDALWADGRHSDQKVAEQGIAHEETKILGKRGTVFLVDTSALHKGAHPETESRLMAQVQYTNSLFGRPLAPSDHKVEMAQTNKNKDILAAAAHVRKYAGKAGVRFMQNYI